MTNRQNRVFLAFVVAIGISLGIIIMEKRFGYVKTVTRLHLVIL